MDKSYYWKIFLVQAGIFITCWLVFLLVKGVDTVSILLPYIGECLLVRSTIARFTVKKLPLQKVIVELDILAIAFSGIWSFAAYIIKDEKSVVLYFFAYLVTYIYAVIPYIFSQIQKLDLHSLDKILFFIRLVIIGGFILYILIRKAEYLSIYICLVLVLILLEVLERFIGFYCKKKY